MLQRLIHISAIASTLFLGIAWAEKISGTVSTTKAIKEDSQLVGDVTCTVSGLPCLDIVADNVTLDLNGFTVTGLGDPQTGCGGSAGAAAEHGVRVLGRTGVTIRGPGIVQRFRNQGIVINGSIATTVTFMTLSTNCNSGIIVNGGSSLSVLENNVSIRNGTVLAPCGGI
jgi:hypothetical protein